MKPIHQRVFFVISLILHSAVVYCDQEIQPRNASIIVLGRSGTGISSTVRKLLGPHKTIISTNSASKQLIEIYEVPLGSGSFLKIVDVKGLIDGRSSDEDNQVLSKLKSYLQDPVEGLGGHPNFFLLISKFDDNRFHGTESIFVQTLRRIQLFQKELYANTIPNPNPITALLLTRLMSVTKTEQSRPNRRIEEFRTTIRQYKLFPQQSIEIVVGENLPEEFDLVVENGQTILPNREYYPQNVFNMLEKIAINRNDNMGVKALSEFIIRRNQPEEIILKSYPQTKVKIPATQNNFFSEASLPSLKINKNDLNKAMQNAFDNFNATTKAKAASSLEQLQNYFQSSGKTTLEDLPKYSHEKAKLFQAIGTDGYKLDILSTAFNLSVPEFVQTPVVGYGFDITLDESLLTTPFVETKLKPSSIGYLLTYFISCSNLEPPKQVDMAFFSDTFPQYISKRMSLLGFEKNEIPTNFNGTMKTGFTLKPNEYDTLLSLTTVREFRTIKCELQYDLIEFNDEFKTTINNLQGFDSSVRDSVNEWQIFFNKYGTHIVSLCFGGGRIEGLFSSQSLKDIFQSNDRTYETLRKIVDFRYFPPQDVPTYRFFGGSRDNRLTEIYGLKPQLKEEVLAGWKNSLMHDPIMLDYELRLTPISTYAKMVNISAGNEVQKCMELLTSGKLNYQRKKPLHDSQPTRVPVSRNGGYPASPRQPTTTMPSRISYVSTSNIATRYSGNQNQFQQPKTQRVANREYEMRPRNASVIVLDRKGPLSDIPSTVMKLLELSHTFESYNATAKAKADSSLEQLLNYFQSTGQIKLEDLPKTTVEKVKLFQAVGTDRYTLDILSTAFDLTVPKFVQLPVVGYGFDVTQDESVRKTPFINNKLKPSSIGYLLPDFISCSNLASPRKVDIAFYNDTYNEYIPTRLKLLHFEGKETLTHFEGKMKTGFTLKPREKDKLLSLTTVREIRTIKCELDNKDIEFTDEFKSTINNLAVFDSSVTESVNEWTSFFNKYGTHIVSLGYGGGRIDAYYGSQRLKNIFKSNDKTYKILQRIVNFRNFSFEDAPVYRFSGGSRDNRLEEVDRLKPEQRVEVLAIWKNSLRYDPIMLDYELNLTPISTFAKLINSSAGPEVQKCMELLISGKLKYQRKKKLNSKLSATEMRNRVHPIQNPHTTTPESISVTRKLNNAMPSQYSQSQPSTTPRGQISMLPTLDKRNWKNPMQRSQQPQKYPIVADTRTYQVLNQQNKTRVNTLQHFALTTPKPFHIPKLTPRPKYKANDYSNNTVGQGFNLLTGVVLPNSPFELGEVISVPIEPLISHIPCTWLNNEINRYSIWTNQCPLGINNIWKDNSSDCLSETSLTMRDRVTVSKFRRPCVQINEAVFNTDIDYILHRIRNMSGKSHNIDVVPNGFQDEIPEWVSINDPSSKNHGHGHMKEAEWRFLQLTLNESTALSDTFLDDLNSLPRLTGQVNCDVKDAWKRFFNTYGTHYVKSAFVGHSLKTTTDKPSRNPSDSTMNWEIVYSYTQGNDCNSEGGFKVLKSSMVLESISSLLSECYANLKMKVDETYYQLLIGKLEC